MSPNDLRELAQEMALALESVPGVIRTDPKCPISCLDDGSVMLCEAKVCSACVIRHLARALQRSNSDLAVGLGRELMLVPRGCCEGGVHA